MMEEPSPPQRPVVVEDESPHEFYASLLGKKPKALKPPPVILSRQSVPPVVPPEEPVTEPSKNNPHKMEAAFTRTYQRALSDPPKLTSLSLDESNKGYKMLRSLGWHESQGGLGKRRQGTLTPVKTRIKNDKHGVGVNKTEARVTHKPHRPASEAPKATTKAQRRRQRKEAHVKEQQRAKRARMLLRTDVSDDYEQLYMGLHRG